MNMVRLFGGGSSRSLVFGFMVATAVLSMWILKHCDCADDVACGDCRGREISG